MSKRRALYITAAIVLVSSLSLSAPQKDIIGYWNLELKPGFNFISFPVLPQTPTPQAVIGSDLGNVEIMTWDKRINSYRWAKYDSQTQQWTGNLFLLDRGTGYWINLINARGSHRLLATGHPEQYTKFQWRNLGGGWQIYAPIVGRDEPLSDFPPAVAGDVVIGWDADRALFELAEGLPNGRWHSPYRLTTLEADKAYIAYVSVARIDPEGPPTPRDIALRNLETREDNPYSDNANGNGIAYEIPPYPVIVGNSNGLPVCYEDGSVCSGGFTVNVVRERIRLGASGELEPFQEIVTSHNVSPGDALEGKFKIALTVGYSAKFLNAGDRVYLEVMGPRGTSTKSTSFEIPENDRFVPDVTFPTTLTVPGSNAQQPPIQFSITTPYPNPFNDRFTVEFGIPETGLVTTILYDVSGRQVWNSSRPFQTGLHRISIAPQNITNGIYFFEIKTEHSRGIAKVAYLK